MELIGVSEAQYIFGFVRFFKLTQKNTVFRCKSVKKGPNDVKPCENFDYFIKYSSWYISANFGQSFLMISTKVLKNHKNWCKILFLIKLLFNTTVVNWI